MKNPPWHRDELILALDLYFELDVGRVSATEAKIVGLSDLLNRLPIHADRPAPAAFRNPNGVLMKLMKFRSIDPSYKGSGLAHGSELDGTIWSEFADDRARLHRLAKSIRGASDCAPISEEDESQFPEGRIAYRLHRTREAANDAMRSFRRDLGANPTCEVCGFSFHQTFGAALGSLIEVHDTTDPATISSDPSMSRASLVLVCSNCHRALHRVRPWLAKGQMRRLPAAAHDSEQARGAERSTQPPPTQVGRQVADLAIPLTKWLLERAADPRCEWPYHPRSNALSDFVRRKVLDDLLQLSPGLSAAAHSGRIVCDINARVVGPNGRAKKLDLIVGFPEIACVGEAATNDPLRKAKVGQVLLSLEVKTCMTEHGKATPRLIDELRSSLEVVRGSNPSAVVLGVIVVNSAERFTSPLNLPGPNYHAQPAAADRLIKDVLARVGVGSGAYDALAVTMVDFDNERHAEPVDPAQWVPTPQHYASSLGTVIQRYEFMNVR